MAFGTNTVANQTNSILFGDGVSSANYLVGINVQNPTTTLQIGPNLGFFHYEDTDTNGEVMSDNIYAEGTNLYARTAGKKGTAMVMEDGIFKVFAIDAQASSHTLLDPNLDFTPLILAAEDTLTVNGSARLSGPLSVGPDLSGGVGVIPGTLEFDNLDGELNVHNGTEWRRVVTESYTPPVTPVVTPVPTLVPASGVIATLPSIEYFPMEADASSATITRLPAGSPGQILRITNSGTPENGTDLNDVMFLDYSNTGGVNIDIQGNTPLLPNTVKLSVGNSITVLYDNTLDRWVEVARSTDQ